jgi:hypothetical protein
MDYRLEENDESLLTRSLWDPDRIVLCGPCVPAPWSHITQAQPRGDLFVDGGGI